MKKFSGILFALVLAMGVGFASHASAQQVAAGCSTTGGYNPSTGMSCNGATVIPLGCSSTAGFSSATGMPCNGNVAAANGYNGQTINAIGFLNGCTSTSGYSGTTGLACNMPINGVVYNGSSTVNVGLPTNTTTVVTSAPTTTPGLPTTGAGSNTLLNLAILLGAGSVAFFGLRYTFRNSENVI